MIERSVIAKAFNGILSNPALIEKLKPGVKRNKFANAYQNYLYNGGSREEAENCLAFYFGFNVVIG